MSQPETPSLDELGITIAEFRPSAHLFKAMDQIDVYTADVSTVTRWHGRVFLETVVNGETRKMIGFHLVSASHLRGEQKETNMFRLLARAWRHDVETLPFLNKFQISWYYLQALKILMQYPETRKLHVEAEDV